MGKLSDKAAQLRKECLSILSSGMANAHPIERVTTATTKASTCLVSTRIITMLSSS